MEASIQCRICGADIRIGDTKPGEQLACPKCDTPNLIPLPTPQTRTIKIMGGVINWLWYIALVLFCSYAAILLFCIPSMGDIELYSWEKAPIPIRVTFDEPLRIEADPTIPDADALHARGFETVLVDRWLGNMGLFWATGLLSIGLLLWIIFHVRAFFNNVRAGRPFSRDNPRRIRYMAYSIFVYLALEVVGMFVLARSYLEYIDVPSARAEVAFSWMDKPYLEFIALGVLLFVIAQIFDWGCRLQQEHDLTV